MLYNSQPLPPASRLARVALLTAVVYCALSSLLVLTNPALSLSRPMSDERVLGVQASASETTTAPLMFPDNKYRQDYIARKQSAAAPRQLSAPSGRPLDLDIVFPLQDSGADSELIVAVRVGELVRLAEVSFRLEPLGFSARVTQAPYEQHWFTQALESGWYTVFVEARDLEGNLTESYRSVRIGSVLSASKPRVAGEFAIAESAAAPSAVGRPLSVDWSNVRASYDGCQLKLYVSEDEVVSSGPVVSSACVRPKYDLPYARTEIPELIP